MLMQQEIPWCAAALGCADGPTVVSVWQEQHGTFEVIPPREAVAPRMATAVGWMWTPCDSRRLKGAKDQHLMDGCGDQPRHLAQGEQAVRCERSCVDVTIVNPSTARFLDQEADLKGAAIAEREESRGASTGDHHPCNIGFFHVWCSKMTFTNRRYEPQITQHRPRASETASKPRLQRTSFEWYEFVNGFLWNCGRRCRSVVAHS